MTMEGDFIDPFNLKDEDIMRPELIARTLSRIARFWAQTDSFYSVSQHCIALSRLFPDDNEMRRACLLHEAYEALGGGSDIVTPIKQHPSMAPYREAENRTISRAFELYDINEKRVEKRLKEADRRMMVTEAIAMMPKPKKEGFRWEDIAEPYPPDVLDAPMSPDEAEKAFLDEWVKAFGADTLRFGIEASAQEPGQMLWEEVILESSKSENNSLFTARFGEMFSSMIERSVNAVKRIGRHVFEPLLPAEQNADSLIERTGAEPEPEAEVRAAHVL